jgi:hypothetical protein
MIFYFKKRTNMKSYIYPKLLRHEIHPPFADDPDARSERVNKSLMDTDPEILRNLALRRARQRPRVPYEPFGISISEDAMRVLQALPASSSRSALIQHLLRDA